MSERENFLERWSRKKREAVDEPAPATPQDSDAKKEPKEVQPAVNAGTEKPFDPMSLPLLESITAETDIRDFLRPGVPSDLKREALRRAWSADPGIRDFVGLVENGWDFNDPNAMEGFGPIEPSEVARLMAQFVLTPADEEKVANALETMADQDDRRSETAAASNHSATTSRAVDNVEADSENHGASQNGEAESAPSPPPAERSV
jgi:hypothetical protein